MKWIRNLYSNYNAFIICAYMHFGVISLHPYIHIGRKSITLWSVSFAMLFYTVLKRLCSGESVDIILYVILYFVWHFPKLVGCTLIHVQFLVNRNIQYLCFFKEQFEVKSMALKHCGYLYYWTTQFIPMFVCRKSTVVIHIGFFMYTLLNLGSRNSNMT